ncbi:carbon-nitrogen hydrolase family protein [Solicola gregarius]|uniref:Carbon-nitrogen hydrolase family protein n=1 Tax=Solicola gregarius TaxID=2908642 RepID=A0AA46TEV3_9ACTN|nr:carbon-nitrogen hydrolase family protein [Solicola gregarius]UYM03860.1 carbon-nitrogen hydrolase family protein [Solicola gregarius]
MSGPPDGPTPRPLVVAAAQAESVPGDVAANARTAAAYVREAADRGARVLVLPELFLSGYDMRTIGERPEQCDVTADALADARLETLRSAVADTGLVALVGASVRRGDRRTISLLAIDEAVRVVYDKQHVCGDEADHFVAGDARSVLTVDGWPLGLAVCYDGCFPEHARAAADDGALAYVASVAYVRGSEHRRDLYYRARAVENGMYAVVSGLTGRCGEGEYGGGTSVIDPEGRVLERVHGGATGLAVTTLDAAALEATRAEHTMYADHRASLGPLVRH